MREAKFRRFRVRQQYPTVCEIACTTRFTGHAASKWQLWPLIPCLVPPIRLLYTCTGERDLMEIVIDTSAVLAVITHEPDRDRLLALTG
jgi:hypothetical protein